MTADVCKPLHCLAYHTATPRLVPANEFNDVLRVNESSRLVVNLVTDTKERDARDLCRSSKMMSNTLFGTTTLDDDLKRLVVLEQGGVDLVADFSR